MRRFIATVIASMFLTGCAQLAAQPRLTAGRSAEAKDMALVGFNDLQARSAYQPVIHRQGNRFIAYVGHHGGLALNPLTGKDEPNGTSIIDVTDPRSPEYLAHIPGSAAGSGEAGGAQMVRVCDSADHRFLPGPRDPDPAFCCCHAAGILPGAEPGRQADTY
jgi:hypothetical protein